MGTPRLPNAKADITGAAIKNPKRYNSRKEPSSTPLGKPSSFLDDGGKRAWEAFRHELPWLMESDRAIVEIASRVRGELMAGEDVSVTKLSMLQAILSKLGGDPANRSKVFAPPEEEEPDEFFGNA